MAGPPTRQEALRQLLHWQLHTLCPHRHLRPAAEHSANQLEYLIGISDSANFNSPSIPGSWANDRHAAFEVPAVMTGRLSSMQLLSNQQKTPRTWGNRLGSSRPCAESTESGEAQARDAQHEPGRSERAHSGLHARLTAPGSASAQGATTMRPLPNSWPPPTGSACIEWSTCERAGG